VFSDFSDESVMLGRGTFADLDGELTRWRENAIKVAGLFALAEVSPTLTGDHAKRGCAIVRWAGYSYLGILSAGRAERKRADLDRLLEILEDKGGAICLGDLQRSHSIKRPFVQSVIAAFPEKLELQKEPTGGRPLETLRACPDKPYKPYKAPQPETLSGLSGLSERGAA
jgi:hypothetical protein